MGFGFIIIIVIFAIFVGFAIRYGSPSYKGKMGEERTATVLTQLPDEYRVLNDVMLELGNGTTQIDHVVVSPHGIFVIETKNYRGDIYGSERKHEWKQVIVTDVNYARKPLKTYTYVTKNEMYNPIFQSHAHVSAIKKVLGELSYVPVIPIVVFVHPGVRLHVECTSHVIYLSELLDVIRRYESALYLNADQIGHVSALLTDRNLTGKVDGSVHARGVYEKQYKYKKKLRDGVCPECGGALVKRDGRYGTFLGCSNYPRCKYTYNL